MNIYIKGILTVLCMLSFGCSKDELLSFDQKPKIYIYKRSNDVLKDSTTYSFAVKLGSLAEDTVFVPIRIMGGAVGHDRKVNYELSAASVFDPDAFELLPAVIKANQFAGTLPILVKKTSGLEKKETRLWLKLIASDDFEPGVSDQLSYLVKINDFLSKPPSWYDFRLGKYSDVKYALIIKVSGFTDFTDLSTSQFLYISQLCKNAILDYEAINGPMLDEDRDRVTFP